MGIQEARLPPSTFSHADLVRDTDESLACSGCVGFHVKALVQWGCARGELEEMLAKCGYPGGGPALMRSAEVIAAWDKLSA